MRARAWLFLAALSATAYAQPDIHDHRKAPPGAKPPVPPAPPSAEPNAAPPPPRAEKHDARAGFVWVAGQWEWKNGQWSWLAGHWERERAGKKWRDSRWENQGGHWKLVAGGWDEAGPGGGVTVTAGVGTPPPVPVPPPGDWPTAPPPPPQTEKHDNRAGFVWVAGEWEWKAGKYNWTPGHWERERAGKKWRESRWENQSGHWVRVAGDWEDAGAVATAPVPPPPPPGPGAGPAHDHRHDWKLERPTISSYWPIKGKPGTRVTIKGLNIPNDASVVFDGKRVMGAMIKPTLVAFQIPNDATDGKIAIHMDHGRDLPVGAFEVKAGYDAEAEAKKLEAERQKAAQAAWAAQQAKLAKDRAARQAAIEQREQEMEANREQRREQRVAEIRAKWQAAFLADPNTQDELTLHAQRIADLTRMKDMAELTADAKIGVRIDIATQKENDRHEQRMQALHDAFGGAQ
jgi:hypothetical protein